MQTIMITGGAGYVGAVLVPKLLDKGYQVTVLDIFVFGKNVFGAHQNHPHLKLVEGDLRDPAAVQAAVKGADTVIHLACISNDPSFELDPALGQSINFDAFTPLVDAALAAGTQRFIYASSSSVYGIKEEPNVTEDLPLEPLTDYSKFKAMCEEVLLARCEGQAMTPLIIRPATVCGYSPRQRLDLTVNILTHHAVKNGKIKVFGGNQKRPNIHIEDMTDLYVQALEWPADRIRNKIYNVGYENHTVMQIAEMVKAEVGPHVEIIVEPTNDHRSYHISSEKIAKEQGFAPTHTIQDAVRDLVKAFQADLLPDSMEADHYYNIRVMKQFQELALSK
ncbi:UDP-glucose 4-epimerase [bacterium (Candidatus Blackallbacteria) CG17_big_fil_post_rev_8_21_14_2_50_48_46]|uniref:UDP-glucose 4-epimerase n=1 Tax=bacterium (Candidatus Blackallbacteria) CG17_big_fil_post_rev_8_21_14_2_50_48_46 TaxID=2014261 RepID=A0A2M7GAC3_9BACT|nr:MAG: UDP-glucose 4-epimerase [bacterium (Candidatus Blackallbacteria) CG18_big_fil_WC_8_21_14_2_50_49_26]PIW19086.1 MAG: UDP-glucose 4-epimerase [bacterium (Candidatus Blackallbacteria) CG17_big_fil_post_rev_8_21_14_2_50_48_46]PIW44547.1 MAG: UDP-glucose 4-epimerase [bacterium (Candidatus Blackallbacteria) CG13_big_fil_rev_8_21_14_2_50_49_14]